MSQSQSSATAAGPAASYASSVSTEASYHKQDMAASSTHPSKSVTKSIKSWTKELVSDIGKPPTQRYDAAQADSSSSAPGTSTVGGPFWVNNMPRRT